MNIFAHSFSPAVVQHYVLFPIIDWGKLYFVTSFREKDSGFSYIYIYIYNNLLTFLFYCFGFVFVFCFCLSKIREGNRTTEFMKSLVFDGVHIAATPLYRPKSLVTDHEARVFWNTDLHEFRKSDIKIERIVNQKAMYVPLTCYTCMCNIKYALWYLFAICISIKAYLNCFKYLNRIMISLNITNSLSEVVYRFGLSVQIPHV